MMKNSSTRHKGCLTRLGHIFSSAVTLIILLAVTGMSYQAIATSRDLKVNPPPGNLFNVGDHQLHVRCVGAGSPTVILEAGLGENSVGWYLVQSDAAQTTRVCAYDRAGVGWSDSVQEPLSSAEIAQDLHTLLAAAKIEPPYVLVGHSAGGVHVRTFTGLYPDEVVGMVLVDSSHEQQTLRQQAIAGEDAVPQDFVAPMSVLLPTAARLGILRLLGVGETAASSTPFPAEIQAALAATKNRTAHAVALNLESQAFELDASQPNPPASLGDLPLIVITRGIGGVETMSELPIPELPADYWQKMDELWLVLQNELADLSTNSQHWMAEVSDHMVPHNQPAIIVTAIQQVIGATKE
jgi:pimeloyl-ACP methyl ester carboxylesterase